MKNDFYDYYHQNKIVFDDFINIFPLKHPVSNYIVDYKYAVEQLYMEADTLSNQHKAIFNQHIKFYNQLLNKESKLDLVGNFENNPLIGTLEFEKEIQNQTVEKSYSFKIFIGSDFKTDEDKMYRKLEELYPDECVFTKDINKEEFDKTFYDKQSDIACILGHGNNKEGLKIQLAEGFINYISNSCINRFKEDKKIVLLSCSYKYFTEKVRPDISVILSNNSIAARQQVAFISFFLSFIKKGYSFKQSFLLTEYALSAYYYTHNGTELYKKNKMVYEMA